jgi:thiamine-phosphate pyrophosphorylase
MKDFPRLYAIIDRDSFAAAAAEAAMAQFAGELLAGGVTLIQYRNKRDGGCEMLSEARALRRVCADFGGVRLIMNDRADLCMAAGFHGVHLGQDDLSAASARLLVGGNRWVGISTHNPGQAAEAERLPVDYIAVGPVYATASKADPDPAIGLEGVREARQLTGKPLIAIGGITRANCRAVLEAGADAAAVIADLLAEPRAAAAEFLRILS